jgi:hypothetical protein
VSRFALHRQGQNSHVFTHCQAMPGRGLTLVLPHRAGRGYRPTDLNVSPSTDGRQGLLPALGNRVSALGEVR